MDRRTFLSATTLAAATAPFIGASALADTAPAATAPKAQRLEELSDAIIENRMVIDFDGQSFSGPGYDWLMRRGSESQAFLLGEEHGIAENPRLASQLFGELVPLGYRHVVVEISPPMADVLDEIGRTGGQGRLRSALSHPDMRVAFFGLREEADWIAKARSKLPQETHVIWGIDYEVLADRWLIPLLKAPPKPALANAALNRLDEASKSSWARYEASRDPRFIFSFAGDPGLARAVSAAWPNADPQARRILDTIEQTLTINALYVANKGYESNLARSRLMRSNLLRYWRDGARRSPNGRLFMKMGASHLTRGLSMTDVFDVGTLVPELAAERGGTTFHLLALPGPDSLTANFDPTQLRYRPGKRNEYGAGMELFDNAVVPRKFTVFDTAAVRPLASSASGEVPLALWRVIHGFDAVLVMTGSSPSSNL